MQGTDPEDPLDDSHVCSRCDHGRACDHRLVLAIPSWIVRYRGDFVSFESTNSSDPTTITGTLGTVGENGKALFTATAYPLRQEDLDADRIEFVFTMTITDGAFGSITA